MRPTIPEERRAFKVRVSLPELLQGEVRLKAGLVTTLIRLDEWLVSVRSDRWDWAVTKLPESEGLSPQALMFLAVDVLTEEASGIERDLLRKSMLEAVFSISTLEPQLKLRQSQFKDRFSRFVDVYGPAEFMQRFLALHVFNVVWFQICDLVRVKAKTNADFLAKMNYVERSCRDAVLRSWTSQKLPHPLTHASAQELVDDIAKRLCCGA